MTPTEQLNKLEPTLRAMAPDILAIGKQAHAQFGDNPDVILPIPYSHFMIMAAISMAWLAEKDGTK